MLDIRDFGADSSGNNDSSAALQQAIDAITSGTDVGPIFVPTGTFKIAAPIVVANAGGAHPNQNPIRIMGTIGSILNMTAGFVKSYTGMSNSGTVQPYDGTALRVRPTVTINTPGIQTHVTYLILYSYSTGSTETFASDILTVAMAPDSTFTVSGIAAPPTGYSQINVYASTVALTDPNGARSNGLITTITASPWTKQLAGMPTLTAGGHLPQSLTIPTQMLPAVGFVPSDVGSFVVAPGIPSGTVIQAYISATSVLLSQLPLANLTVPITINTPKFLTQGNGNLSLEHLAFEDVNGGDAAAPAPFLQSTKTSLHIVDCSFTGVNDGSGNNNIATITGVSTTAGSNQVTFTGSAPAQALGAAVFCTSPRSDVLPFDTCVTAVSTGGTTTLTLSQNANGTVSNGTLLLFYTAQDAIVLGGTSEVQDDSPNGGFAGYNTTIDGCRFQWVRRAVFLRSAANACVIRANNIGVGCSGGFSWEPAIDIEGGQMGASSNVIDGNVVEIQWYKTGVRVMGWSNTLVGNYLGDSGNTPGTITYWLPEGIQWYNTIIGGTCDNGPVDESYYGRNAIAVGDRKTVFSAGAPILSNLNSVGAYTFLLPLSVPSGVTVSRTPPTGGSTAYSYKVTALNAQGQTVASAAVGVTNVALPATDSFNLVSIPHVVGANSYNIYGRFPASEKLITTVKETGNGASWADFGVLLVGSTSPPSTAVGTAAIVRAWQSQAGNLQQWESSAGGVLSAIDANGNLNLYGANGEVLPMAVPSGVSATAEGTTGSTSYGYRVSAVNAQGETLACSSVHVTNGNSSLSTTNYVQVAIPNVNGAANYNVYGRTFGSELFMATVPATGYTVTWSDTGSITPSGALPGNPAGTGLVVQAWQGQTGDMQEWRSSTGAVLAKVDGSGNATFANFDTAHVASDVVFSSTTLGNITGLSFSIGASQRWSFEAYLELVSASTNGGTIAVSVPAGATVLLMIDGPGSSTTSYKQSIVTAGGMKSTAFLTVAATGFVNVRGVIVNSTTAGTVQLQAASGSTSNFTVKQNSYLTGRLSA